MLSFAEEILLVALDDKKGVIKQLSGLELEDALIGAVLMDLALLNRIDTDPKALMVVDPTPTRDALLDDILQEIQRQVPPQPVKYWITELSGKAKTVEQRVLERLIAKGILKQENKRLFWVFQVRRYPQIDRREIKEVKARLRDLILGTDLPDPRDAVLISLIAACRLFDEIFTPAELAQVRPRIAALAKLDLIGQEVAKSIRQIEQAMAMPMMI